MTDYFQHLGSKGISFLWLSHIRPHKRPVFSMKPYFIQNEFGDPISLFILNVFDYWGACFDSYMHVILTLTSYVTCRQLLFPFNFVPSTVSAGLKHTEKLYQRESSRLLASLVIFKEVEFQLWRCSFQREEKGRKKVRVPWTYSQTNWQTLARTWR